MASTAFPLLAIAFGWPAVIASITLVIVGVIRRQSVVALAGALLACPFLLYLSASPRIGWLSLIVGVLYIGSSQAIAKCRVWLALALAAPFVVLAAFVAVLVLNQ